MTSPISVTSSRIALLLSTATLLLTVTTLAQSKSAQKPKGTERTSSAKDSSTKTSSAYWPQWRGPNRNGISTESGWKVDGGARSLWSKNVGMGYSCVTIEGGKLYTIGHDKSEQEDSIFALDLITGKELWKHTFPAKTMAEGHGGGSLTTPSIDGKLLWVSSREGKLFCFERETGKIRWEKDVIEEYGLKRPRWGYAAAPLILDEMVVLNIGRVVALNRKGKLLWKTEDFGDCYSTPVDFTYKKKRYFASFSGKGLSIIARKTGKVLDTSAWKTSYDVNAATPVVIGNKIFISSGYNKGCAMLQFNGKKLKTLWQSRVMRNHMSGCVAYKGHLYGFDMGTLKCLDLDGEEMWAQRGLGKGALVIADGKLVCLSHRGKLVIAEASPKEFTSLSSAQIFDGGVQWTTPVVAGGLILVRSSKGNLVCLDRRPQ